MHNPRDIVRTYPTISGVYVLDSDSKESPGDQAVETNSVYFICQIGSEYFQIDYQWKTYYRNRRNDSHGETKRHQLTREEYIAITQGERPFDLTQARREVARAQEIDEELKRITPKCPLCQRTMEPKVNGSTKQRFWGCPAYKPNGRGCKGTSNNTYNYIDQLKDERSKLR